MRHIVRLSALFLAVAMTVGPLAAAEDGAGAQEEPPKGFWVEEESLDLGAVAAGKDAIAVYTFHNDTDQEVRILRAKPS